MRSLLYRLQGYVKVTCPRCQNVLGYYRKSVLKNEKMILHCNCSHSVNASGQ